MYEFSKFKFFPSNSLSKLKTVQTVLFCSFALAMPFALSTAADAGNIQQDSQLPYQVKCPEGAPKCLVDKTTYIGWRTYHAVCHVCHAQDAVGSTFAPSLIDRLEGMSKERFMEVVLDGYTGQIGVMPGWKQDPNVLPKVENLWSFLKARSDGALPTGKPKRLPPK